MAVHETAYQSDREKSRHMKDRMKELLCKEFAVQSLTVRSDINDEDGKRFVP